MMTKRLLHTTDFPIYLIYHYRYLLNHFPGPSATNPGLPEHTLKGASVYYNLEPAPKKAGGWECQHYALKVQSYPTSTFVNYGGNQPGSIRANGSTRCGSDCKAVILL